jgi:hypothetical protein
MITPDRLTQYIALLRAADWYYDYSDDPRAWRTGRESVHAAKTCRDLMMTDFPDDAEEIERLYVNRGRDTK